jgi:hypothetical protein
MAFKIVDRDADVNKIGQNKKAGIGFFLSATTSMLISLTL